MLSCLGFLRLTNSFWLRRAELLSAEAALHIFEWPQGRNLATEVSMGVLYIMSLLSDVLLCFVAGTRTTRRSAPTTAWPAAWTSTPGCERCTVQHQNL